MPILDFPAYTQDELYNNCKKHDFTKYITPQQTLAVDASVSNSGKLKNSMFVAQKVKDAVVDQFQEKFNQRPSVDVKNPDLKINVRLNKNQTQLSVDTSVRSLSLRGYRTESVMAPLREHLAAGLLMLTNWQPGDVLVDPMCGSGSFLIEAALQIKNCAPGLVKPGYAFQRWKSFQPEAYAEVLALAQSQVTSPTEIKLYGFDISPQAIDAAKTNAKKAGVADMIVFKQMSISNLKNQMGDKGTLVVNPPYGERLGLMRELEMIYKDLGDLFKNEFKGWSCWVLSGNTDLSKCIRLKANIKHPIKNGSLDCRWLNYQMY